MPEKNDRTMTHKIAVRGTSLEINEMYFPASQICFADVVQQNPPIIRGIILSAAVGFFLLAAVTAAFGYFEIAIVSALFGIAGICLAIAIKPRYALRIVQKLGSTKCMISTDREELEAILARIVEALRILHQNTEDKQS